MRRCHGIAGCIGCSHGPAVDACQEARKENQTHSVIHLHSDWEEGDGESQEADCVNYLHSACGFGESPYDPMATNQRFCSGCDWKAF